MASPHPDQPGVGRDFDDGRVDRLGVYGPHARRRRELVRLPVRVGRALPLVRSTPGRLPPVETCVGVGRGDGVGLDLHNAHAFSPIRRPRGLRGRAASACGFCDRQQSRALPPRKHAKLLLGVGRAVTDGRGGRHEQAALRLERAPQVRQGARGGVFPASRAPPNSLYVPHAEPAEGLRRTGRPLSFQAG